jgi:hypothetical protein
VTTRDLAPLHADDLVLDTSTLGPEAAADRIVTWLGG